MNQDMIFWTPGLSLEELEKQVIKRAIQYYRGNKTSTAAALKISIRTLDSRLELYAEQEHQEQKRRETERERRAQFDKRQRGNPQPYQLGVPYEMYNPPNARDENENPTRQEFKAHSPSAQAGVQVEPIANTAQEQTTPMSERKEVQGVLPKHAPSGHKGKGR